MAGTDIGFSRKYEPLFRDRKSRVFLLTGGRASGKSFAVATNAVCRCLSDAWQRVLYTRWTLVSAEKTIIPEFKAKIRLLGSGNYFRATRFAVHCANGNGIWFSGIKAGSGNQTANLKSLEGVTTWIVDEAEELVDPEIFHKIAESVRHPTTQNRIIIVMNPATTAHWIYNEFFKRPGIAPDFNGVRDDVRYICTDYRDNLAHIPSDYLRMIERLRESDREAYDHRFLGRWVESDVRALFRRSWVEQSRVDRYPDLDRIVVAVDPAASDGENSDACGIVVAGKQNGSEDIYILEDATEVNSPAGWAKTVARLYRTNNADMVVAEKNQGGDMVRETLISAGGSFMNVRLVAAKKGKAARAEPVSALYEQGKVHHVQILPELEDEICDWIPDRGMASPNRMDALVYAVHALADDREVTQQTIVGLY